MLCHACTNDIADYAKFCPKCGAIANTAFASSTATKRCPTCGTECLIDAKFCKTDGYRFGAPEDSVDLLSTTFPNNVICPACGTANPISAKFCKKDGVRLVGEGSPAAHTEITRVTEASPQSQTSTDDSLSNAHASMSPSSPKPVARQPPTAAAPSNTHKWAVAILMLLALASGGAGGYLYYTGWFISPAELKANISSALIANGIQGITVDVGDDRVATLSGDVVDVAIKDTLVALASSIKGIKDVRANLNVLPSIRDTEHLVLQALKDRQLTDVQVKIDEKRDATLTGGVGDAALIQVAANVATATPGVKSVTNQLWVMEVPEVTYTSEPEPTTAPRPTPRPSRSPKLQAAPSTSSTSAPTTVPAQERKRINCEGTWGPYLLICTLEGPALYFKCAPDGKNWNNSIPGCERKRSN